MNFAAGIWVRTNLPVEMSYVAGLFIPASHLYQINTIVMLVGAPRVMLVGLQMTLSTLIN